MEQKTILLVEDDFLNTETVNCAILDVHLEEEEQNGIPHIEMLLEK